MSNPFGPAVQQFNSTVNGLLSPFDAGYPRALLRLVLILYAGLAAPKLPLHISKWFSNSFVRTAIFALIVWVGNRDPVTALVIAVVYFMTLNFATKNAVGQVAASGKISPEVQVIVTANSGPSIKGSDSIRQDTRLMQESVDQGKFNPPLSAIPSNVLEASLQMTQVPSSISNDSPLSGPQAALAEAQQPPEPYDHSPEATLASMPKASAAAVSGPALPTVPSGTSADSAGLTADFSGVRAYESDSQAALAEVA